MNDLDHERMVVHRAATTTGGSTPKWGSRIWLFASVAMAACLSDDAPPSPAATGEDSIGLDVTPAPATLAPAALPTGGLVDTEENSGWTDGQFSVSDDGAAEYHFPLWMPRGQGGLTPELAIHYNSNRGNGILGVGWSLQGLSSITPCQRTIGQDGRNEALWFGGLDTYCLDGQRLRPVSPDWAEEREYRTQRDSYARITAHSPPWVGVFPPQPDSFTVETRDGKILTYGGTNNTKAMAYQLQGGQPENPSFQRSVNRVTAAWALRRVEDRRGNRIDFAYDKVESGADRFSLDMVPSSITYAPNRQVTFVYLDRTDPIDAYRPGLTGGVHLRVGRRLARIDIKAGGNLVRRYFTPQSADSVTQKRRLSGISECDALVCMKSLSFGYATGTRVGDDYTVIDTDIRDISSVVPPRAIGGDINGDGADDIVYRTATSWKVRFSNGLDGFGEPVDTGIAVAFGNPAIRAIDYNLDGRMDLLVEVESDRNTVFGLFRGTTSRTAPFTRDYPDFDTRGIGGATGLHSAFFADVDGDGQPDYLAPRFNGDQLRWTYRLRTASGGFAALVDSGVDTPLPDEPDDPTHQIRAVSLTGDRSTQLLTWDEAAGRYAAIRLASDGLSTAGSFLNLPFAKLPENADRRNLHFADVNGDGLEDAVYPLSGLAVQLGSGAGFSDIIPGPTEYLQPEAPVEGGDVNVRIGDLTGDGVADILLLHPGRARDANDFRNGFQLYSWRNGAFVRVPIAVATNLVNPATVELLDMNGDGRLDILHSLGTASVRTQQLLRSTGTVPDKLTSVKVTDVGDRVVVYYSTLADPSVYTTRAGCAYPLVCPARGGQVVRRLLLATGKPDHPWNEYRHKYEQARVDARGQGWLGFREHTVFETDRQNASTTTTFDNSTSVTVEFTDGAEPVQAAVYPYAHLPATVTRTVIQPLQWTYQRTIAHTYTFRAGAVPGTYDVVLSNIVDKDRERPVPSTEWRDLHARNLAYEFDKVAHPTKVTTTVSGTIRTDDLVYTNDESRWLLGQMTSSTATSCTRATPRICQTRTTGFVPDPTTGQPAEILVEPNNDSLFLHTTIGFGAYGNVKSVTKADSTGTTRVTTITYDANGVFPTKITDPLGHTVTVTPEANLGVPLDLTDANGVLMATMRYDKFGRLRETYYADGNFEKHAYQVSGSPFGQVTTKPNGLGGALLRSLRIVDSVGRVTQTSVLAFDGKYATVNTSFDVLGRIAQTTQPYEPADDGSVTKYYTTYSYDLLDRPTQMVEPGGVKTRYSYIGLETHTFDGRGVESYVAQNGDGLINSRYEDDPNSTAWLRTRVVYGPFNVPTQLIGPDGTTQTLGYDALGHRVSHVDPSSGTTTSTYNGFGELIEETNGAGETTINGYDALGRLESIESPDGVTTFTWDTVTHGIGKLGRSDSADGVATRYAYDTIGRPYAKAWDIEGTTYRVDQDWDSIGRLSSVEYPAIPGVPGRFKLRYQYSDKTGHLLLVKNNATGARYWRAEAMDAAGNVTAESFGGTGTDAGVVKTTRQHNEFGLPAIYEVTGKGDALLDRQWYVYDANRNLQGRLDGGGPVQGAHVFTHDTLNRLRHWTVESVPAPFDVDFTYNTAGNLTSETWNGRTGQNATYTYGQNGAPRHALSTRNGLAYSYDAAGREISGPDRTIDYNTLGLPVQLTHANGDTVDFAYDAAGSRVLKRDPAETNVNIAGIFERRVFSTVTRNRHYIMADGRPVAVVLVSQAAPTGPAIETATLYMHTDNQGSFTLATNTDGTLAGEAYFDPFGRRTNANYEPLPLQGRQVRVGFTGHEHDDELGLVNMKGRVYDPWARSFLTPDPYMQAPLLSQGLNRYSYVFNNPVTLTDPTGFDGCSEDPNGCPQPPLIPIGEIIKGLGKIDDVLGDFFGFGGEGPVRSSGAGRADDGGIAQSWLAGGPGGFPIDNLAAPWDLPTPPVERPAPDDRELLAIIIEGLVVDPIENGLGGNNAWAPSDTTRTTAGKTFWQNFGGYFMFGMAAAPWSTKAIRLGKLFGKSGAAARGTQLASAGVDPRTIRFSQTSIKNIFSEGGTLSEAIEGLKSGAISPNAFPPIRVLERNGLIFTLDNRRLFIFQQAGVPIRTVPATDEEIAAAAWKFTTKNEGVSIRVRGGL